MQRRPTTSFASRSGVARLDLTRCARAGLGQCSRLIGSAGEGKAWSDWPALQGLRSLRLIGGGATAIFVLRVCQLIYGCHAWSGMQRKAKVEVKERRGLIGLRCTGSALCGWSGALPQLFFAACLPTYIWVPRLVGGAEESEGGGEGKAWSDWAALQGLRSLRLVGAGAAAYFCCVRANLYRGAAPGRVCGLT